MDIIRRWPGKKSATFEGGLMHSAVYHMLDVAAVAECLIDQLPHREDERDAIVVLAALHDLGKVNAAFEDMLMRQKTQAAGRHWEVTELLLNEHQDHFSFVADDPYDRKLIYAAVAGHHGQPPTKEGDGWQRMRAAAGCEAIADAGAVIEALKTLWPKARLSHLDEDQLCAFAWWLPGFITTADWIGSNPNWFPAVAPEVDIDTYLKGARDRAAMAMEAAGQITALPTADLRLPSRPRPMQLAMESVALPSGPTLAIVEDGTGSGKTDAALLLAHRMMIAEKGKGIYFALPTMATSDAMFARVRDQIPHMFETAPTLTLAHGRAALSQDYRALHPGEDHTEDEAGPTEWLLDSRRRALLAQVGVGTIDQVLLAVLKAKHFPLRLFALSSKILIVDEVHEAGDPYMLEILGTLLRAHRQNGGSAILLTATLPIAQRNALLTAWGEKPYETASYPYPSLTVSGAPPISIAPVPDLRGPILVKRCGNTADAIAILAEGAKSGAACVWIRNAVDDAIDAVKALRDAGVEADLLHARFALTDRIAHQTKALRHFDKDGVGRSGKVLVATQIVEASLDLDFDVMVSDIAPISSLIQRAGRLWRHMDVRPQNQRPYANPVLQVLSPDPEMVTSVHWLSDALDRGAYTYPVDVQWRTAKALFEQGQITTPEGLRPLIEAVEGEVAPDVPDAIAEAEAIRQGEGYAAQNLAQRNCIQLEEGYRSAGSPGNDQHYPTRLGEPQTILALARMSAQGLVPYAQDPDRSEAELWMLSEVSISTRKLRDLTLPDQDEADVIGATALWPDWKKASVTVCAVSEGGEIAPSLQYYAEWGLIKIIS